MAWPARSLIGAAPMLALRQLPCESCAHHVRSQRSVDDDRFKGADHCHRESRRGARPLPHRRDRHAPGRRGDGVERGPRPGARCSRAGPDPRIAALRTAGRGTSRNGPDGMAIGGTICLQLCAVGAWHQDPPQDVAAPLSASSCAFLHPRLHARAIRAETSATPARSRDARCPVDSRRRPSRSPRPARRLHSRRRSRSLRFRPRTARGRLPSRSRSTVPA